MPFAPTITFDLAAPNRSCRFTIDAAALGAIPDLAIPPDRYLRLCTALAQAIRTPTDEADATILGGFALLTIFAHPGHGADVRRSFSAALRVFDPVVIAVLIDDDQIGFSIGDNGDSGDLANRLDRLEGNSEVGEIGPWPVAAAH